MAGLNFSSIVTSVLNSILSPVINVVSSVITAVSEPFVQLIGAILPALVAPIIQFSIDIVIQIVPAFLNALGLGWVMTIAEDALFVVVYGAFLYIYSFGMEFCSMVLDFLPVYMLLFIITVPFIPMIYFVYSFVATYGQQDILNRFMNSIQDTVNFFVSNIVKIVIQLASILAYMIIMALYDLLSMLPPVADKLDSMSFGAKFFMNMVFLFPVWWLIYEFYEKGGEDIPHRILDSIQSVLDTTTWFLGYVFTKTFEVITAVTGVFTSGK